MDVIDKIKNAATGLVYISETDHPFEVFELPTGTLTAQQLLTALKREPGTKTETQDLDYFFRNMVRTYEGATQEEEQHAERFRQLKVVLQQTLHNITVYRLGEVSIDAVITGIATDGRTIALRTKLVET